MRRALLALLIAGCWTNTATPPPKTPPPPVQADVGGTTYGGATYGGAFAALTGTGDISSGFDNTDIYGGLLGNDSEPNGGFGGVGGAGVAGTNGLGSSVAGQGRGRLVGAHQPPGPHLVLGQAAVSGGLDKAIVRRYIKRNLQKLVYCYEKQLSAHPGLHGSVTATFKIGANGVVTSSSASGIKDVAQCVADVIQAIEFPAPKDTASVDVSYPITFELDTGP